MKKTILLLIIFIGQQSFSQSIVKSSIDSGGASASNGNIEVLYTIGEVNVQELSAGNIIISEGFINPIILKLNAKIFLEGAYVNSTFTMADELRDNSEIPTTSPYVDVLVANANVFDLGGSSGTGATDDDIVDWVWLEFRDSSDSTIVIEQTSALLQRDGDVVGIDGVNLPTINIPEGNYHVMLSHRNHLGVLTANPIGFVGGVTQIDLTANSALVMGNTNGISAFADGSFALYSGDYNGDGQVQNTDKIAVEQQRGMSGYNNADIDMNSEVQNTDLNNLLNPNLGKGEQFTRSMLFAKRKEKTKDN